MSLNCTSDLSLTDASIRRSESTFSAKRCMTHEPKLYFLHKGRYGTNISYHSCDSRETVRGRSLDSYVRCNLVQEPGWTRLQCPSMLHKLGSSMAELVDKWWNLSWLTSDGHLADHEKAESLRRHTTFSSNGVLSILRDYHCSITTVARRVTLHQGSTRQNPSILIILPTQRRSEVSAIMTSLSFLWHTSSKDHTTRAFQYLVHSLIQSLQGRQSLIAV